MATVSQNLDTIRAQIKQATKGADQSTRSIKLVAVSKGKTENAVQEAIVSGQRVFGENRVQEAHAKFENLRKDYPNIELHLIGSLQTNKVRDAVSLFDVIETLDRPKLAEALSREINKSQRNPQLLVQVNIGQEPQKAGIYPEELDDFLALCRETYGLHIDGLMCIPPQHENPEPYFIEMKTLADRYGLEQLSMGMSNDFEPAIRCGATSVRIGTAIFGKRQQN